MAEGKMGRPDANTVRDLHMNADTDSGSDAIHHTLGTGVGQAASGAHDHDGNNSPLLLEGITITGARGTATCDQSIIAALVRLGASDSTT